MPIRMRFHDFLNVYNILIDEEMYQHFKQVKFCVVYKWQYF